MQDDLRSFVTSTGREIPLRPIASETLDDLRLMIQKAEEIRPPTYTVQILDGEGTEEVEHDLTTLKTDEDRAAWDEYQQRLEKASGECNKKVTRTYLTFGIDTDPPDDGWEEDFEFCGISIPEKAAERKVFYFERVALSDPADQMLFVQQVYLISELSVEALERADATFQRGVEGGGELDSPGEAEGPEEPVET